MPIGFCLQLKAKMFSISTGKVIVILNEVSARKLGIRPLDRVELTNPKNNKSITAVVDISADHFIADDEIGLMAMASRALDAENSEVLEICPSPKPESLFFIKHIIPPLPCQGRSLS